MLQHKMLPLYTLMAIMKTRTSRDKGADTERLVGGHAEGEGSGNRVRRVDGPNGVEGETSERERGTQTVLICVFIHSLIRCPIYWGRGRPPCCAHGLAGKTHQ